MATLGIPGSAGVLKETVSSTISLPYQDLGSVEKAFRKYAHDIAAVVVEPVAGNMGVVLPQKGFLEGLSRLTKKYGVLLIFDEVITGFRLALGGAQGLYRVQPDLTCLGKIIGGGFPVGAYGGKRGYDKLAPLLARIQNDRGQTVCRSGPYRIVRHPGYSGTILQSVGTAFLLGSIWSLVPAAAAVACMVARTVLEDRMLQNELPGYKDFAQDVPHRLVPGVW